MDPAELHQEIERTREQLGQTVDDLVAKADIKARAKEKAGEVLGKARDSRDIARGKAVELSGRVRQRQFALGQVAQRRWPLAVAAAAALGAVGSVALRKRRRNR